VSTYTFTVTVKTDTLANARRVMAERLGFDEDYGFDYEVDWTGPDEPTDPPLTEQEPA
jgi:hypothetical protein